MEETKKKFMAEKFVNFFYSHHILINYQKKCVDNLTSSRHLLINHYQTK